jgi:hypothetical protein
MPSLHFHYALKYEKKKKREGKKREKRGGKERRAYL